VILVATLELLAVCGLRSVGAQSATTERVIVTGQTESESLTSPSTESAAERKTEVPGGFSLRTTEEMRRGRVSNFEGLLQRSPGVFLQTDNGTEVTRVSIRGSGILSEDEPVGVQLLLDGLTLNQADGEAILEDFDLATIKYAEVFRGANAFKYGSLTRSRLWPQPHRRRAATLLMKRNCST
jgi:iron complex outermembrane receptor protein